MPTKRVRRDPYAATDREAQLGKGMPKHLRGQVSRYLEGERHMRSFVRASMEGRKKADRPSCVMGYGLGVKQDRVRGVMLAVRVYVNQKVALSELQKDEIVPRSCLGLPTDVVPIGRLRALSKQRTLIELGAGIKPRAGDVGPGPYPWAGTLYPRPYPWLGMGDAGVGGSFTDVPTPMLKDLYARRSAMAPLQAGTSISPEKKDSSGQDLYQWAGTLGYFVRWSGPSTQATYILSNNHVMADWTTDRGQKNKGRVPVGATIVQPGVIDDPIRNPIATLSKAVEITVNDMGNPNHVDMAIAEIDSTVTVQNSVYGWGKVNGLVTAANRYAYQTVVKGGRTTGITLGLLYDLDANISVDYGDNRVGWFEHQIGVMGTAAQPDFSAPGDSGSLVIDYLTNNAVGLLFAGSDGGLTFINPIDLVVSAFQGGSTGEELLEIAS